MPTPAPEIVQLLSVFAIAFTAPTWKNAQILLFGAILAPGATATGFTEGYAGGQAGFNSASDVFH